MKPLATTLVAAVFAYSAAAQHTSTFMSARATGVAYASSCLSDHWSIFNNPGGLAGTKSSVVSASYDKHTAVGSFDRMAAVAAIPATIGVFGGGVFRFGDELYNEQIAAVAFSNKFGIASLGAKVSYIQYQAEGFGSVGVLTASFGGIAELTEHLHVGAHIQNINQPAITLTEEGERIPTILAAGMAFKPNEKVLLLVEAQKNIELPISAKAGLEYQFHKKFAARTGYGNRPNSAHLGFGFDSKKLAIDYGLRYAFLIGFNHQLTLGYRLSNK